MSKLFEMGHWLWTEVRLGSPDFVQRTVMPQLNETKERVRLVTKPHLTVSQWQGHNKAGSLSVSYAGLGYIAPILQDVIFAENPTEKEVAQISIKQPSDILQAADSDVVIVEAANYVIDHLPPSSFLMPFRLRFVLDLSGSLEDVENRFRRDARRNEMGRTKKYGYDYEVSHDKGDLEMFYNKMYLPTLENRHGELARPISKREAHQTLRHGLLFFVKRDGLRVAGGLCFIQQGLLRFKEMGVLNGSKQLMREGAVGAMNYLRVCWAHKAGCQGVNFGECWPYMSGIYLSKRKWGATVGIPPHENKQVWVGIRRNNAAVTHFLEETPWITTDSDNRLYGLIVTPDAQDITPKMEERWEKSYETPGLDKLIARTADDLVLK